MAQNKINVTRDNLNYENCTWLCSKKDKKFDVVPPRLTPSEVQVQLTHGLILLLLPSLITCWSITQNSEQIMRINSHLAKKTIHVCPAIRTDPTGQFPNIWSVRSLTISNKTDQGSAEGDLRQFVRQQKRIWLDPMCVLAGLADHPTQRCLADFAQLSRSESNCRIAVFVIETVTTLQPLELFRQNAGQHRTDQGTRKDKVVTDGIGLWKSSKNYN